MATIATCPECEQQVTLPPGASPQARVSCPLCQAEYLLEAVLKRLPPQLMLLDAASTSGAAVWTADEELELEAASEPWTPVSSGEMVPHAAGGGVEDAVDFGDSSEPQFSSDHLRGMPAMAPLPGPRYKPSIVRQMVGVAGGAVVGLSLGYILLLWIGGPHKDFLKIGRKLPAFLLPAAFHPETAGGEILLNHDLEPSHFDDLQEKFGSIDTKSRSRKGRKTSAAESGLDEPGEDAEELDPNAVVGDFVIGGEVKGEAGKPSVDKDLESDLAAGDADPNAKANPPAVQVRNAPAFSASELGAALGGVLELKHGMLEGSLEEESAKAGKIAAFRAYCELAQVFTFVEGRDGEEQLGSRKSAVRDLLKELAAVDQALLDLGNLSDRWIHSNLRPKDKPGVIVAGDVLDIKKQGDAHALLVMPAGREQAIKIVFSHAPLVAKGDQVVLLGSIVDAPEQQIDGYFVSGDNQLTGEDSSAKVIFSQLILKAAPASL